jgi:uncharacterized damage-inducible protein DinB
MLIETLKALFDRDLKKLRTEIASYTIEENLWKIGHDIKNSAGNLCLHLVGNLNAFVGKAIGGFDYVRNRDAEFSLKNVPRKELLDKIDKTIQVVDATLSTLDERRLHEEFEILVFEKKTTIEYMLVHLCTHLSYHLGQINYHRRLMDVPG